MSNRSESIGDDTDSVLSSSSSEDEDSLNIRVSPNWERYRGLFEDHGFHLDTVGDVKRFYEAYWERCAPGSDRQSAGYTRACGFRDDKALCKDPGLHDNLFRGRRKKDHAPIIVKAVHLGSREFDITRFLSSPPLRTDPKNHCIPVLDFIEDRGDGIAFIVMEEWSPELIPEKPCCLGLFVRAIRSTIEHVAFMHLHRIAHLDISIRNLVTDYKGHYACIDYELSRRFDGALNPKVQAGRATELPPELERGELSDPFKVDVWALGILILKASYMTGYLKDQLIRFVKPMLCENQEERPCALDTLMAFDTMVSMMKIASC
ncbi:hypothetical protein DENSPDRAFT_776046 [Dentipellis sp. KUC8613]|nr:hypothetical protein DENSPDRAFT_776046 [Dentipellis sp. KUC8613]